MAGTVSLWVAAGCQHCGPRLQPKPPCAPDAGPPVGQPLPKGPGWLPDSGIPPPGPVPSQSKSFEAYKPPLDSSWKIGAGPSVRLYPPEVSETADEGKKPSLRPPEVIESNDPVPPKEQKSKTTKEPPSFPVGIPQYALVRDKVAAGLRPSLDDGLDWLQTNGFKTVLCLHEPGEPISADRKQVEKRGMKFVSVEVSPGTLTEKIVEEFNRLVGDKGALPLFVYDRDGALAGSLWYLHFRVGHGMGDEAARQKARTLGLREDREGLHQEMWQAAKKYLGDKEE
jgi:protein tyrosine phosphatase (PTP) superfamily phosphohydrolase (DUF442 family)